MTRTVAIAKPVQRQLFALLLTILASTSGVIEHPQFVQDMEWIPARHLRHAMDKVPDHASERMSALPQFEQRKVSLRFSVEHFGQATTHSDDFPIFASACGISARTVAAGLNWHFPRALARG